MRRSRGLELLLVILLLGLAACTGRASTPPPARQAAPQAAPTTLAVAARPEATAAGAAVDAGRERVADGDLNGAEAKFREALALDPQGGAAHAGLSRLYLDLAAHDQEALSEAQEAVRLAPADVRGWVALTYALGRNLQGTAALEAARSRLALNEQDAQILAALSYALLLERQPSEALDAARRAVQADTSAADAYLALADAYETQGDFARARAAVEKALTLEPGNLAYGTRLGGLLTRMLLFDEAAAALDRAAERSRRAGLDYLPALLGQIDLALARGDYTAADKLITSVEQVAPGWVGARLARAEWFRRRGDTRAAETVAREALAAAPDNFDARLALGYLALEADDCTAAAYAFVSLALAQPRMAGPVIGEARAAACADSAAGALDLLNSAIDLEPCNVEALARLGTVYLRAGDRDLAEAMYARAWRCSTSGAVVQAEIGGAALDIGNPAEALDAFRLAYQLNPSLRGVALGLCIASVQTGDIEHGVSACEEAGQDPQSADFAALARAEALLAAGRPADAATLLRPLEPRPAAGVERHRLLGVTYIKLKDYAAALAEFEALKQTAGRPDPRLDAVLEALESGWELASDEALARLRAEVVSLQLGRPVSVTVESGAGGRKLALELASPDHEAGKQVLEDMAALMVAAGRIAPRVTPPVTDGVEVRAAGPTGERPYTLRAPLSESQELAALQLTGSEFLQRARLVDEGPVLASAEIRAIGNSAAQLRRLRYPAGLPLVRLSQETYAERLATRSPVSRLQRADAAALYVLLGLLEPGADLLELQNDWTSTAVNGIYDQDTRTLAFVGESGGTWQEQLILAHEYTHAMQDQEFRTSYLADNAMNNDIYQALNALEEGDASLVEYAYIKERLPVDEELAYAWTASQHFAPAAVPQFVAEQSTFPYEAGADFVRSAYDTDGWAGVNALFSSPPTSTEQILHPDRYGAHHLPVAVALPSLAASLGDDWGLAATDVMGELGWRLALAPAIGKAPAAAAAEGWGGDRYALLRRGTSGEYAAAFQTAWDDPDEAEEFAALAGTWLDRRTGYGQVVSDLLAVEPDRHWVQGQLHWLVRRQGKRVTIVVAPGSEVAQKLLEANYPAGYLCESDTPAEDDVDEVLAALDKEIEAHPSAERLLERAAMLMEGADLRRAILDLNRAIELDPQNADAWLRRGYAHFLNEEYDAAIGDLTRALELRPGDYLAYRYRGESYLSKEAYAEAAKEFSGAINLYPHDSSLRAKRGDVYWSRGEYGRAMGEFQAAIELLPDYADPDCRKALLLNEQGHLWQEQERYEDAAAAFAGGLELRPDDAMGWYDKADANYYAEHYQEALADIGRAIELQPDFAAAHRERGYIHLDQQAYTLATADFTRAIELEPDAAESYYGRGYTYLASGWAESDASREIIAKARYWLAIKDLDEALELDAEYGAAYFRRGQAYHGRGDLAAALADYDKAIELLPEWNAPYASRGYLHMDRNEKALAIADFEKYLELTKDDESRAEVEKELKTLRAGS